jgi:hypothetical protein
MKAEVERISTLEFYSKRNGACVLGLIKLNQYLVLYYVDSLLNFQDAL